MALINEESVEAIEKLLNEGLSFFKVSLSPGGKKMKPEDVGDDELQATRADLRVLLYELSSDAPSRAEATKRLVGWAISDELRDAALPQGQDFDRFCEDTDSCIATLAELMHCTVEEVPTQIVAVLEKPPTGQHYEVPQAQLVFTMGEDEEESIGDALRAIFRVEDALGGKTDLRCPSCGRGLGMFPHLCAECAVPSRQETEELEEELLDGGANATAP